jgi:hypothetical protein
MALQVTVKEGVLDCMQNGNGNHIPGTNFSEVVKGDKSVAGQSIHRRYTTERQA